MILLNSSTSKTIERSQGDKPFDQPYMREVVLFFPDTEKLAEYVVRLNKGAVEISSSQLTLNAFLNEDEIADAVLYYEATPICPQRWMQLQQSLDECSKKPNRNVSWYPACRPMIVKVQWR